MPVPLSLLAALSAAVAQPVPAADERDLLVAHADGSWTITRDIEEAPVSLARLTNGVLEDDESPESYAVDSERDRMREEEEEGQVERVFEEAVDAVNSADPRRQD